MGKAQRSGYSRILTAVWGNAKHYPMFPNLYPISGNIDGTASHLAPHLILWATQWQIAMMNSSRLKRQTTVLQYLKSTTLPSNTMKNTSTQKLISASFALFTAMMPLLGAQAPAEAAFRRSCKDVYLKVQNNTGEEIKVIDLDYWDPSSGRNGIWRSEPVSNEVIPNGQPWQEVRNLEKVDQMNTRIRVQYRKIGRASCRERV